MKYKNISFDISESIAKVILNRPDAGNVLNTDLVKELYDAISIVASEQKIKVLVLTAKGKLFCGGGDLKFLLSAKEEIKKTLLEMTHYFHGAIARMARMEAPVIIAIGLFIF